MDLRSLRYFAEIAQHESYSRAAAVLRRSQPALTRCMQELERELGLNLFRRVGRRIALTSNGKALLGPVVALLSDADAISQRAKLLATGQAAILRVGVSAHLIERVMPMLLQRYRKAWPHVEVFLKPEGGSALLTALERGEIDVALTRDAQDPFLSAKRAFPVYSLAAMPRGHRLSRQKSVSIHDLEKERLLVTPASVTSRRLFDTACVAVNVRPRPVLEIQDLNALVALAEAGQGVAIIPSTVDKGGRDVVLLPIVHAGQPLASWIALVWAKSGVLSDYAEDFVGQACALLGKTYPGRDLRLPVPRER